MYKKKGIIKEGEEVLPLYLEGSLMKMYFIDYIYQLYEGQKEMTKLPL